MKEQLDKALDILRSGGVILHRPDTIWGLSCDATSPEAVQKIDAIKARETGKSYIILVDSDAMMERYVEAVPEVAYDLIDAAVDPLTIIYPHGKGLASGVCAEDGSIGIRIVQDPLTRQLVQRLKHPIISTSANISGQGSPQHLDEIASSIKESVEGIIERNDRPAQSKASAIIKLALNGEVQIIRS
ncbi:MAG: threonylcarbamoyl-AMP synthase [Flavobacteriales bacterium]|nr:threonylcarbamoyl-AMP synthase [Flavobacteriales bacterium]